MNIDFHKSFTKQALALKSAQKKRLKVALVVFANNPQHADLHNHSLAGRWKGFRSISFGGDWRALYEVIDDNTVLFVAVGTHSQLYK